MPSIRRPPHGLPRSGAADDGNFGPGITKHAALWRPAPEPEAEWSVSITIDPVTHTLPLHRRADGSYQGMPEQARPDSR